MPAIEVISGRVTAPGGALTELTPLAGDSFVVRSFPEEARAYVLNSWALSQGAGIQRIRSPRGHDNLSGIRLRHQPLLPRPLQPFFESLGFQQLRPNDRLIVDVTGSGTAGDIETHHLLIYYEFLSGIEARLISPAELEARSKENYVAIETAHTAATTGEYGGAASLASLAASDVLKGGVDYALVGYLCSFRQGAVTWRGGETGNLRIGGWGSTEAHLTASYFLTLSYFFNRPCIPVFNGTNKATIFVETTNNEDAASPVVTSIFVELQ